LILPRDAMQVRFMPSCGIRLSVRLSRSWFLSKRISISSIFYRLVAAPF